MDIEKIDYFAPKMSAKYKAKKSFSYTFYAGKDKSGEENIMTVRLLDSDEDRLLVEQLVNRMYSWRGYGSNHSIPVTEDSMTFAAYVGENPVGTLTLTVDSPKGLAADFTFHEELGSFRRAPGAKICELTKFAFDSTVPSKTVLAALFQSIFIYGSRFSCTDLFIEVNPRHRRFYEIMLGFQMIGDLKMNVSVNAPSQLMSIKVSAIRDNIECRQGHAGTNRSLYPFFMAQPENTGLDTHWVSHGSLKADAAGIMGLANPHSA